MKTLRLKCLVGLVGWITRDQLGLRVSAGMQTDTKSAISSRLKCILTLYACLFRIQRLQRIEILATR